MKTRKALQAVLTESEERREVQISRELAAIASARGAGYDGGAGVWAKINELAQELAALHSPATPPVRPPSEDDAELEKWRMGMANDREMRKAGIRWR